MKASWIIYLLLFACLVYVGMQKDRPPSLERVMANALSAQMEDAANRIPVRMLDSANQRGSVHVLSNGKNVFEQDIVAFIRSQQSQTDTTYLWRFEPDGYSTATAQGLDNQHHFVNSYLVGYSPFQTDKLWVPLYTVATRKQYQLDSEQYQKGDLWQNSAQAYLYTRGDCEDHALLLADWLIASGIDARVVMGNYRNEGHAWVVAFKDGEAFLLEATDKRRYAAWRHYPKASLAKHYAPEIMFNRHSLWLNQGSKQTRDYQGSHWQKRSVFKPASS
ncbi:transglutaminase-like domain-containing protein [Corallincola platygyrae]|uniref:Transglutaminase-like domain-containing protein n=1 Tax=Corallincola platygyrae TaxID=1193278 RepID=A0ABW4XMV3_9GAMM